MTTELMLFKDKKIRIEMVEGEPYICLQDICRDVDIRDTQPVLQRLRKSDVFNKYPGIIATIDTVTETGRRGLAYINEMGLYEIIGKSRKPKAKAYYSQIIATLPGLRKQAAPSDTTLSLQALKVLIDNQIALEQRMDKYEAKQEKVLAIVAPVKEVSPRSKISQIVREFAYNSGIPFEDCWHKLYYEFKYRYKLDLPARASNRNVTGVQIAEELDCVGDLLNLAVFLFVGGK